MRKPNPNKDSPPIAVDPRSLTNRQLRDAERRRAANDHELLKLLGCASRSNAVQFARHVSCTPGASS